MRPDPDIAVIGSGSWATALLKILEHRGHSIHWWVRTERSLNAIRQHHKNPKYLSSLEIDLSNIQLTNDIREAVSNVDICLLAVPSFFLKHALAEIPADGFRGKLVLSAIKGIVPGHDQLVSEYLFKEFGVQHDQFINISGPSHAEEVAFERRTYLTLAAHSYDNASYIADLLKTYYLTIRISRDIEGLEYAAVLKNVYAIAGGICNSLGFGDNFQAVLIAAATREMKNFLDTVCPLERNILDSGYLGDLLVTAYSQFSRNRTFGNMIGKGYSTNAALMEMNMVPEGYYAIDPAYHLITKYQVDAPILTAVYHILHEGKQPDEAVDEIVDELGK